MSEMKTCTECKTLRKHFYNDHRRKDGLTTRCKECLNKKTQQYRINNRAKLNEYNRLWMRRKRGGADYLKEAIGRQEKKLGKLRLLLKEQEDKLFSLKSDL